MIIKQLDIFNIFVTEHGASKTAVRKSLAHTAHSDKGKKQKSLTRYMETEMKSDRRKHLRQIKIYSNPMES